MSAEWDRLKRRVDEALTDPDVLANARSLEPVYELPLGDSGGWPEDCTCDWNETANHDRSIVVRAVTFPDPTCPLHARPETING